MPDDDPQPASQDQGGDPPPIEDVPELHDTSTFKGRFPFEDTPELRSRVTEGDG